MRASILTASSLLSLGLLTAAEPAEAQFLRKLGDRLADAVERRVEQNVERRVVGAIEDRAEEAVDNSFDAMFTAGANAASGNGAAGGGSNIFSRLTDTSNVKVADSYDFDISATFEVYQLDSRGRRKRDEDLEMVFYYSENAPYTGTRMLAGPSAQQDGAATTIIYDFEHQLMLMLMESEGERFAMPYNWGAVLDDAGAWPTGEEEGAIVADGLPAFERIGSRKISGYNSEGYRVRDDEHVTEIWVSTEVASGIERVFQANRSMPMLGAAMPAGYPQGMLMELNAEDLKSGETVVMRTTDIDMNAKVSYRMSDYPILNLGAMMNGGR